MTLSESCRFGFTQRSWTWSQMGFFGSSKRLYQLLSWGLGCKSSFLTRICENFMSQKLMVFSFLRLRFVFEYCLRARTDSSIKCLVELEDGKSVFLMRNCERTTCTENTFWFPAIKVGLFSNVVFVYEHFLRLFNDIFRQVPRSRTVFLEWMWEGRTFFQKLYLTLFNERLIVQYRISSHSKLQSKIWLTYTNYNIVFQVIFRRNNFFKQ